MKSTHSLLAAALATTVWFGHWSCLAQTAELKSAAPIAASAPTAVPSLIPYYGTAYAGVDETPVGDATVTFQIFKEESGGEPLWIESQVVAIDPTGHYQVHLGATNPNGLPTDLFMTGEARWLEVQVAGQVSQPRVLLASVPYALKASDAATLGGLPASAFMLAGSRAVNAAAPQVAPNGTDVTTTGGTAGYIPEFSGVSTIIDSPLFVLGSDVGIGTATPTATLDVNGTALISGALTAKDGATIEGLLVLPPLGTATTTGGFNSQQLKIETSAYNSSSKSVVEPRFQWQAVESGNNTAAPSATLNLLSSTTTAGATETGFFFNANGTINFAPGQVLPSSGTVAADLSLPATTSASAGVLNLGGQPFLFGYPSGNLNAFVGGAGNFTTTGDYTTATGYRALHSQTTGYENTADGGLALYSDTTGTENSAVGLEALYSETTGSANTAVGYAALFSATTGSDNTAVGANSGVASAALSNTTAIGYHAIVGQNNTMVLGNTTAGSPGAEFVNVGIGTATPISTIEASVSAPGALGPVLTLTNPAGDTSSNYGASAIDFNTQPIVTSGYNPGARIEAVDDGNHGDDLLFLSNTPGKANNTLQANMEIFSNGNVLIGAPLFPPPALLTIEIPAANYGVTPVAAYGADGPNDAYTADGMFAEAGDATGVTQSAAAGAGIEAAGGQGLGLGIGGDGGQFFGGDTYNSSDPGGNGITAYEGNSPEFGGGGGIQGLAGNFIGNVAISGTLNGSTPQLVKIDHPLDAANKYLSHAAVQSSEMMDIYSGNVVTDELGLATITLPDWFESLNTDFRYQLTTIGRDAHAWVAEEVANKHFKIATNATGVKVSWQITAVRQDAYSKANPLVVEETKPARERGFYIQPALYGQPAEKQVEWGRRPEVMQRMKAERDAHKQGHHANNLSKRRLQPQPGTPASAVNRNFAQTAAPRLNVPGAAKP